MLVEAALNLGTRVWHGLSWKRGAIVSHCHLSPREVQAAHLIFFGSAEVAGDLDAGAFVSPAQLQRLEYLHT